MKKIRSISAVVFLFVALAGLFANNLSADQGSKYLNAVRQFADNVLKDGRDAYGPRHTPFICWRATHTPRG